MSYVDFENLLYLSPVIAVYPDMAIVNDNDIKNLNYVLDMCEREIDKSKEVTQKNNRTIIPLKIKE